MILRDSIAKIHLQERYGEYWDAPQFQQEGLRVADAILDLKVTTWDKPFNPTWKKVTKTLRELEEGI